MTTYTVPITGEQFDPIGEHIAVGTWVKLFVEGASHYAGVPDRLRIVSRDPLHGTAYGTFAQVVAVNRDAQTLTVQPNAHRLADHEPSTAADFDPYVYLAANGAGHIVDYGKYNEPNQNAASGSGG